MIAGAQPTCWIIAGPNGAGKTTFALDYLPKVAGCEVFVNADLIAAGMSPLAPERERIAASRIFLREIERHVAARRDFGFETTHRTFCLLNSAESPEIVFTQEGAHVAVKRPDLLQSLLDGRTTA